LEENRTGVAAEADRELARGQRATFVLVAVGGLLLAAGAGAVVGSLPAGTWMVSAAVAATPFLAIGVLLWLKRAAWELVLRWRYDGSPERMSYLHIAMMDRHLDDSFALRQLSGRGHPVADRLVQMSGSIRSTVADLSDLPVIKDVVDALNALAAAAVECPMDTPITVRTGEFSILHYPPFLDAIDRRVEDAEPARICGHMDANLVSTNSPMEFLENLLSLGEKNRQRYPETAQEIRFTPDHAATVSRLMDEGKLEIYLLPERVQALHWGLFGTQIYLQQRHLHDQSFVTKPEGSGSTEKVYKDMAVIGSPYAELQRRLEEISEESLKGATKVPSIDAAAPMLMSQAALEAVWGGPEEDAAWADL